MQRAIFGCALGLVATILLATAAQAQTVEQRITNKWWTGTKDYVLGSTTSFSFVEVLYDGRFLWVGNHNGRSVSKIDPTYGTVIGTYSTPGQVSGIIFDGEHIWASNRYSGSITRFRASDGTLIGTYAVGNGPQSFAFDGSHLYVSLNDANQIVKVNPSTGAVVTAFSSGGTNPYGITFDGSNLWVSNAGIAGLTQMSRTGTVIRTVSTPSATLYSAYDGTFIWTTAFTANMVTKINASSGAVLGNYAVGTYPTGVDADGTFVYVANQNSNSISILRASSGALVRTISVGAKPLDVAFDGLSLWTANNQTNTISRR